MSSALPTSVSRGFDKEDGQANDINGRAELQSSHSPPRSIANGKVDSTADLSAVTGALYFPVCFGTVTCDVALTLD